MPANLSPEYKAAEEAYRKARDPGERLEHLRDMLRTIPKHKGTEHLQADIKTRIKQLTEDAAGPQKGAARRGPPTAVRPEGAAQLALIGPPSSGKSALHARLTGSGAEVGPYPYTTRVPMPGMLKHEDIQFQLVDLPPIDAGYMEPWMPNALQLADGVLLVVDLSEPSCVEQELVIRRRFEEKRISLTPRWPTDTIEPAPAPTPVSDGADDGDLDDPFHLHLPTALVAAKSELVTDPEEVQVFLELVGVPYPALSVSVETGQGLDDVAPLLFQRLGVVRVYPKAPGKPPDRERPFTVRRGDTVYDVARLVHRELASTMKYARLWGTSGQFDGQQVGKDHPVADGDVLELHG